VIPFRSRCGVCGDSRARAPAPTCCRADRALVGLVAAGGEAVGEADAVVHSIASGSASRRRSALLCVAPPPSAAQRRRGAGAPS